MIAAEEARDILLDRRAELIKQIKGPARDEAPGRRVALIDSLVELENTLAAMRATELVDSFLDSASYGEPGFEQARAALATLVSLDDTATLFEIATAIVAEHERLATAAMAAEVTPRGDAEVTP